MGLILPNHHNCEGSCNIHVVHMDIENINKCKYKRFENTWKIKMLEQNGNWLTNEFDNLQPNMDFGFYHWMTSHNLMTKLKRLWFAKFGFINFNKWDK